jgi:TonB family protein
VLAVVGALAVFGWVSRGREAPAPTSESSLPATTNPGVIKVETRPAGARIHVNGAARGDSPVEIVDLPTGQYEVEIRLEGYATRTQTVTLSDEDPRSDLMLALLPTGEPDTRPSTPEPTPRRPPAGRAAILSTPAGADVFIAGRPVGKSPLSASGLPPGEHDVELRLAGHAPWQGKITIEAGKSANLRAELERIPPVTATPAPVDTERVYLNTTRHVDQTARKISGDSPKYPAGAARLESGESASVSVSFIVTREGNVDELEVVESGGAILDAAVLDTIRTWKYAAAQKQGVKVKVKVSIKQTFRAG